MLSACESMPATCENVILPACYLTIFNPMKFLRCSFLFLFLLSACTGLRAQHRTDSISSGFAFSASFAYQVPGGDLAARFGNNANAGASAWYKSKKNLMFNLQWSYLFGETIHERGVLDSIRTSSGFVLDKEGKAADIRMFERGFTLTASGGKLFGGFLAPNMNSGFFVMAGGGMLQHKIRIIDNGSRTPQLAGDYLKGYDRLTSGFTATEFLGYWYMSKRRYVNFYAGFEAYQGFTKSRRSWDYDLMRADTERRLDLLWGFRAGWVIPIAYRDSSNLYTY